MRFGTYYRWLSYKNEITKYHEKILDVGCYDGFFLSKCNAKIKVGIDLDIVKKYKNIKYIKGDICKFVFKDKFDKIFAFEIIEHVDNDKLFLQTLVNLLNKNGELILTTPHKNIKMFPGFITNYLSRRWGHNRIKGYSAEEIKKILPLGVKMEAVNKRELFNRLSYLPLRLLWFFSESFTKVLLKMVVYLDNNFLSEGERGGLLIKIKK